MMPLLAFSTLVSTSMQAKGVGMIAQSILADMEHKLVVSMHLPVMFRYERRSGIAKEGNGEIGTDDDGSTVRTSRGGFHLRDSRDGPDRSIGVSWFIFGLQMIREHVVDQCIVVHVLTDAPDGWTPSDAASRTRRKNTQALWADVGTLEKRFPDLAFHVHGAEVPETDALIVMARSHALLAGGSSFSRLAAVLSRGVVLAPGSVPLRPLRELRAVVVVHDFRFWDRSSAADLDFWEGRSDVLTSTSRLVRLFLEQRHSGNSSSSNIGRRCMRVASETKCRLRWTSLGSTSVQCS